MNSAHDRYLFFKIASVSFFLAVAMGCKREADQPLTQGFKVGTSSKLIEEMAPSDVIVSVNGTPLTRENYDDAMAVKEALFLLSRPGAQKQDVKIYRPHWSSTLLQEFIARQVILQAARAKKHQPSAEAVQISRTDMGALLKVEERDLERKFTELGRVGRSMKTLMDENALIRSFREAEHGASLKVSPADIEARIQGIKAYHERAEATNRLVIAKGRRIYEQAKKGEDFLKLAALYSEAEDKPLGEWGTFVKGEIENAKVREAAFTLPVGSVSEPIDMEEGLVLIKIVERTQEVLGPAVEPSGPSTVKLMRILLRLAEGGADAQLPPREHVEMAVATQKVKDLQQNWIPALMANSLIEYPNGTNLWLNAKAKKPTRPQRGLSKLETKEETK